MKFLPKFCALLTFCTCLYEVPTTAPCVTDILFLSLRSSFHSSVCYWHSVIVIMKLLLQICVLLTFCSYHYEVLSTVLCTTDILHLSLWSSFYSSVCIGHSVPVIMRLLPQHDVLLTFCISHYESPSAALCDTDIRYRALWRSFQISVFFWIFVTVIMKLFP